MFEFDFISFVLAEWFLVTRVSLTEWGAVFLKTRGHFIILTNIVCLERKLNV